MVSTHLHMLLQLHPLTSIPKLVQRLKGGSSVLASREGHCPAHLPLKWERGYDIESVSARALDVVRRYIRGQPERHPEEAIQE